MNKKNLGSIHLQVMWNRLLAVVEEQAQALLRTAFSPIVRECGDLSAGIFDTKGRMLAQAVTGTPGHVNSMAESVKHFIKEFPIPDMREGDAYVTNDPWRGTGHLNDLVVTTPAFRNGRVVALFSCTSHLTDIGGLGFGPMGRDVFMEGLSVPFLKILDQGRWNETLLAVLRANTRLPVELEGDLNSLISCNRTGCERAFAMMDEFGLDVLDDLADTIIDNSQTAVLSAIRKLPAGAYENSMVIDGYEKELVLKAAITINDDGVTVDYSGTSGPSEYGINVPMSYTSAYTCFALRCVLAPEVANNAGSLAPIKVTAPKDCLLNAQRPAPVSSRHVIGQMLPDVIFGCLRQIIPERVPAEGASCLWLMNFRQPSKGGNPGFALTAVTNGGAGARPGKDGLSATAYPSGVRGTPVEIIEALTPLLFWRKELRKGSGGAGQWRGGHGLSIEIENRDDRDVELLSAFDRVIHPARGCSGGGDGAKGALWLRSNRPIKPKGLGIIAPGDVLIVNTPGGGGIGSPNRRDKKLIEKDALDDLA
ncbi:MAG: 5-oxoprolinase [Proteobacteria bacterium]|nr:MAG: 5-oxoprolinase [Pseudomonadota bacterium]